MPSSQRPTIACRRTTVRLRHCGVTRGRFRESSDIPLSTSVGPMQLPIVTGMVSAFPLKLNGRRLLVEQTAGATPGEISGTFSWPIAPVTGQEGQSNSTAELTGRLFGSRVREQGLPRKKDSMVKY